MKITKIAVLLFIASCLVLCHDFNQFKTRVSIFNFGLDYTKYSKIEEMHRSVYFSPVMIERENLCLRQGCFQMNLRMYLKLSY